MKDKKLVGSSQHGFMKGKSCLPSLLAFYDEITDLVEEGRAVDAVYVDFSKAFDAVSRIILIDKLMKCRSGKWAVRWTENWLKCQAQRVVISSTRSS